MDSMRSLNTSLPSSTPRPQPPEQLLQSFKTAALSVTNLYKNAVFEQAQAKQAGYHEAIEDLLQFLDRENLGLGDGEGWRVRQWATERMDGPLSDEDDAEKQPRGSPYTAPRKATVDPATTKPQTKPAPSANNEPVTMPQQPAQQPPAVSSHVPDSNPSDRSAIFTFTAGPSFPPHQEHDIDMQPSDDSTASTQDDAPVSVSVVPRNPRSQNRHNNLSRPNPRTSVRDTTGLGSKRKFTVPDFFDLSGMGNKDVFGGGKRSRFT
ncbi:hypothetical protein BDW42DRAFT_163455 [Aspergillus taichungensis]|uniref:Uncharacterized protein n=1 Tax=Aspergillus taichungensis TaxID=482145 RepID=A0A2J5I2F1_9EURO|nr:hypothetical protein BDW42DRAFT_163455 [Aspergillus taichungensis]